MAGWLAAAIGAREEKGSGRFYVLRFELVIFLFHLCTLINRFQSVVGTLAGRAGNIRLTVLPQLFRLRNLEVAFFLHIKYVGSIRVSFGGGMLFPKSRVAI